MSNALQNKAEIAKQVIDAVAIPGGMIGIASHYLGFMNLVLTFFVLTTSFIWGIYRILDMHESRKKDK